MTHDRFGTLAGALTRDGIIRRDLARGLAGAALAIGLIPTGGDGLAARRRRKKKGTRRRRNGSNDDSGNITNPGGDLCGGACLAGQFCVAGRCIAIISDPDIGDGPLDGLDGIALNASGAALVADTNNSRL